MNDLQAAYVALSEAAIRGANAFRALCRAWKRTRGGSAGCTGNVWEESGDD